MLNWFEDDISVDGVRLHYYRSGGDKPPLVLVHGFTDNALYWTRLAQALEPDWDIIAYDARGHGLSDRADGRFGDTERVEDLRSLIEGLKLHKPGLIGHSMGAATIALLAAQYPQLPRFVILEDPAWFEHPIASTEEAEKRAAARAADNAAWREWVRGLQTRPRAEGLAQIRAKSPQWSELDQNLSLNARLQVDLDLFQFYPPVEARWRQVVIQIQCPILLIIGNAERGGIVTPEQAHEATRLCHNGRWLQISTAGHSIRYDEFDQYLKTVKEFLLESQTVT